MDNLKRFSDAASDWQSAADLADVPMDKAFYLAHCGSSLNKLNKQAEMSAAFAAATSQAESALKGSNLPGQTYYDAAIVFSLAADNPENEETSAAQSVRLLGLAASVGFLHDEGQRKAMLGEHAFEKLKKREDFKQLLSKFDSK